MWSKIILLVFLGTLCLAQAQNMEINTGTAFNSLRFPDAGQASVTLPESLSEHLPTSFTFEAWVMLPGTVGNTQVTSADGLYKTVVSRYSVRPDGTYHNRFADFNLQVQRSGDLNFFMGNGLTPSFYGVIVTAGNIPTDKWTHVAFSVMTEEGNFNPSFVTVYLDGVAFNSTWKNGDRQLREDVPIHLGAYLNQDGDVKWWRGYMDEIRFWGMYMGPEEIMQNMHMSVDPSSPHIVAYYMCDAGSILADATRRYDGQFVSGAGAIEYELSGVKLGFMVAVGRQGRVEIELPGAGTEPFSYVIESTPNPDQGRLMEGPITIFSDMVPYTLGGNMVTFEAGNVEGVTAEFSYYGSNSNGREDGSTSVMIGIDQDSCNPDACGVCNGDNSTCTCLEVPYKGYDNQELERILLLYEIEQTLNLLNQVEMQLDQAMDALGSEASSSVDSEIAEVQEFNDLCLESFHEHLGHFLADLSEIDA